MKLIIDFEKLEYQKPKSSFDIFINFFLDPLRETLSTTPNIPPFSYRHHAAKRFLSRKKEMSFQELGRAIRFADEQANQILMTHLPRLHVYRFLSVSLYFLFALLPTLMMVYFITLARPVLNAGVVFELLSSAVMLILSLICILFAFKISAFLVDRHFAGTLALMSGIYLLVFLEKEPSLSDPEVRRDILERIRTLRRNITLLSLTLSTASDPWPAAHFKQIENFVRERERWVIAPQEQTLDDLRSDFGKFVEILVSGQYGNFEWSGLGEPQIVPETTERKPAEKVIRFLASILPFVLLAVLFLFPAQIKAIGFDNNVVTLFLLAWLLLAIDSGLKLGLVERGATFAKALKDLG